MNSLNSILIEGNLTRDPVLANTPKGTPVCNFSIASNRFYRQEDEAQKEVSFFDVEVWSKLAESCGERLKKGRGVRVVGRLKQDRWADGEGRAHNRVKIVGEHVEFRPVFRKNEEDEDQENEERDDGETGATAADSGLPSESPAAENDETREEVESEEESGKNGSRSKRVISRAEREADPVDAVAEVTVV